MPPAGRQFEPVARQRMTKSNRREVTRRLRSKKMPPRKGWKKRCTMASEKPSSCNASSHDCTLRGSQAGSLPVLGQDRSLAFVQAAVEENAAQEGLEEALHRGL